MTNITKRCWRYLPKQKYAFSVTKMFNFYCWKNPNTFLPVFPSHSHLSILIQAATKWSKPGMTVMDFSPEERLGLCFLPLAGVTENPEHWFDAFLVVYPNLTHPALLLFKDHQRLWASSLLSVLDSPSSVTISAKQTSIGQSDDLVLLWLRLHPKQHAWPSVTFHSCPSVVWTLGKS